MFQKGGAICSTCFFSATAQPKKIKILLWSFICVPLVYSFIKYIPFLYIQNFRLRCNLFFKNTYSRFWVSQPKKTMSSFCREFKFHVFLRFSFVFCLKTICFVAFRTFVGIWPKIAKHVIKRHLIKTFSADFSDILMKDVQIEPG